MRLTVRFDIEDRNFHSETKRNGGADFHFSSNTVQFKAQNSKLKTAPGLNSRPRPTANCAFLRTPANIIRSRNGARTSRIRSSRSRGQAGSGDAYSPGWFELPLAKGANVTLVATAETDEALERGIQPANRIETPAEPGDTF